jgi:hypothetical protein
VGLDTPAAQRAAITLRDHAPYLVAGHRATFCQRHERGSRVEDGLFCASYRRTKCRSDLLMRQAAQLAHKERGARPLG